MACTASDQAIDKYLDFHGRQFVRPPQPEVTNQVLLNDAFGCGLGVNTPSRLFDRYVLTRKLLERRRPVGR